jgi:CcmD family protein
MDNNLEFLFAGFAVFWAGLFVYIVLLQIRLRALQQDIEALEERLAEADGSVQGGESNPSSVIS